MEVHLYAWTITVIVMVTILVIDVLVLGRRPHEPSMKEAGLFIGIFVTLAVIFGFGVWAIAGPRYAGEFFAGWLTEYSLSIDNLFIFLIIMTKLKVPRHLQQFALLVGHHLGLIFRGIFIAVGAAVINAVQLGVLYFRRVPDLTAVKLYLDYRKHEDTEERRTIPLCGLSASLQRHEGLPRHEAHCGRERQAADHSDVDRDRRPGQHRSAVCAGFHSRRSTG
jgi:tellurite resistance protein TerC